MRRFIPIITVTCLLAIMNARAEAEGPIRLDINGVDAMHNSLVALKGRRVLLKLIGGADLSGKLLAVGDNAIYLQKLREPGEFFSAWVPISGIGGIVFRVHDGKKATAVEIGAD